MTYSYRSRAFGILVAGLVVCATGHGADIDPRRTLEAESTPLQPSPRISAPERRQATAWDYGCAEDHFPERERLARQIKLRMPIPANELLGVIPEPAVIHADVDGSASGGLVQCAAFGSGHACYNKHEGTDYSLGGAFLQMGRVRAVAAAPGVVIEVRSDQFDRCHVNTDPAALLDDDHENNVVCPNPDHPESVDVNRANKVSLCHADGTVTEYLHLMRDSVPGQVRNGARMVCGQVVGTVGSSGKSSGPHLHLSVLVPESRARIAGTPTGKSRSIGGRTYVYVDPYSTVGARDLWTSQTWNYAASFDNTVAVPALEHPNGHPTTLACAHLVPPHAGHPGPTMPCTHPLHDGDPVMVPCAHFLHGPHGLQPCTHVQHPQGHHAELNGVKQYSACLHGPKHPEGHTTTVPCAHAPVQQHPGGHPGPNAPCTHLTTQTISVSAFTLPGPQCDG